MSKIIDFLLKNSNLEFCTFLKIEFSDIICAFRTVCSANDLGVQVANLSTFLFTLLMAFAWQFDWFLTQNFDYWLFPMQQFWISRQLFPRVWLCDKSKQNLSKSQKEGTYCYFYRYLMILSEEGWGERYETSLHRWKWIHSCPRAECARMYPPRRDS